MRLTLRTLLAYLDNTLDPQDAEVLRQKVEQSGFATQLVQQIRASLADPSLSAPAPDSVHPIEEPNMMSDYLDSTLSPEQIAEIEKACLESLPHLAEAAACHQILTLVLGRPAEASESLRRRIHAMVDPSGKILVKDQGTIAETSESTGSPAIAGEIGPRFSGVEVSLPDGLSIESEGDLEGVAPEGSLGTDFDQTDQPDHSQQPPKIVNPRDAAPQDVRPVGVDDSGVFQAASKLREQSHQFVGAGTALDGSEPPDAQQRNRGLKPGDLYRESSGSSRVTPWLVSLALVGVLVFAIYQIFTPVLAPNIAQQGEPPASASGESDGGASASDSQDESADGQNPAEQNPAEQNAGEQDAERQDAAEPPGSSGPAEMEEPPAESPAGSGNEIETASADASDSAAGVADADSGVTEGPPAPATDQPADAGSDEMIVEDGAPPVPGGLTQPGDNGGDSSTKSEMAVEDSAGPPVPPGDRVAMRPGSDEDATGEKTNPLDQVAGAEMMEPDVKPDGEAGGDAVDPEETNVMATLVSEDVLVAVRDPLPDADWTLLPKEGELKLGQIMMCAPEYRAAFALSGEDGAMMTLVGPAQIQWGQGAQAVNVRVRFGKGLIQLGEPGQGAALLVGKDLIRVATESAGAVLAFEVSHRRPLGSDPLVPENHQILLSLTSVSGEFSVSGGAGEATLSQGSQITQAINEAFPSEDNLVELETMPDWIDPEVDSGTLEAEAASALLELIRTDPSKSLLVSLRVALAFRRNEVAALAGKTKLAMGDASAYFGVDGLLNDPKQRLYWSSHLDAIREMMARSVVDAASVRTAIAGQNATMDVVEGDTLFRLLVGYSQDQLEAGGDAELVADLESKSMPVRVLASEHLRDISGTTLFFKPEEEIASRRDEVVKKWKVRLRKESIRYPEPE